MTGFSTWHVLRLVVLTTCLLSLEACATVLRSDSADWAVSSVPAGAEVKTSMGGYCSTTPCSMTVKRKNRFYATVSMPGYLPETINVEPKLSVVGGAAFLGNGLIGGLIGASIDVWTGATLDPTPNDTVVTLKSDQVAMLAMSMDQTSVCTKEKLIYALRVGVPCSSLGERFDLRTLGQQVGQ